MNTINATACANLKLNRGRNLLTGIAIMLTAFLIFSITTLGSGVIRFQFHAANQLSPTYHVPGCPGTDCRRAGAQRRY